MNRKNNKISPNLTYKFNIPEESELDDIEFFPDDSSKQKKEESIKIINLNKNGRKKSRSSELF